jgi:large subunit ribosomal protein L28
VSRVCEISGKRPQAANRISRRGKAKKQGGIGRKVTAIARTTQAPNLQKIKVSVAGQEVTFRVAASRINDVYELVERSKGMNLAGLSPAQIKAKLLRLPR